MNTDDQLQTEEQQMIDLKRKLRATWEAGDYGYFAQYLELGALEFLDRQRIAPGSKLLDVACGAGQITIPAAKNGIEVTGLDLAQNLVDQARKRALEEGVFIQIDQGDAEDLPYEAESFDAVLSLIGAMFAPRPHLVASEMIRVCRPGGKIIMGNWTATSFVGQMFKIIGKRVPPPSNFPSPLLWGDQDIVAQRFGNGVKESTITTHLYPLKYPFPPAEVVKFFNTYYGPTVKACGSLNQEEKQELERELTALWEEHNLVTDGTTEVQSEYIEFVGTRA